MPDLVVVSQPGRVFTADPDRPWAHRVHIRDGLVAALDGDVPDGAAVLDAGDGLVIPGFVDGHAHLLHTGAGLRRAQLRSCTTAAEIGERLHAWIAANPQAPRVLGIGWTFSALPDSTPTRELLDAMVGDRPAYLDASDLHSVWVNSAALDELGIDADPGRPTPDPVGGEIVRDNSGRPTGLLLETAAHTIAWPVMNRTTDTGRDLDVRAAIGAYHASGTTCAVDMALDQHSLDALLRADAAGDLAFSVIGHWIIGRTGDADEELAQVARAAEVAARHGGGRVRVAGIKLITDGTIDGCTAGMCAPLHATHALMGDDSMIWPRHAMEPVVLAADEAGLQIALHAIGDFAIRTSLDVLTLAAERRAARGDVSERRHRIEHLEYTDPADIGRLAPLGITASMQPVHVDPAYLDNWIELLGTERAAWGFAWPEFLAHGTRLAFGTDTPTANHEALPNMYIAATRRSPTVASATPLRPDWALPLDQAITHGTRDSAWASFEEHRRGMLRAGLAGDLVILDGDPLADGAETLLRTRVRHTVVGGSVVYTAEGVTGRG